MDVRIRDLTHIPRRKMESGEGVGDKRNEMTIMNLHYTVYCVFRNSFQDVSTEKIRLHIPSDKWAILSTKLWLY